MYSTRHTCTVPLLEAEATLWLSSHAAHAKIFPPCTRSALLGGMLNQQQQHAHADLISWVTKVHDMNI